MPIFTEKQKRENTVKDASDALDNIMNEPQPAVTDTQNLEIVGTGSMDILAETQGTINSVTTSGWTASPLGANSTTISYQFTGGMTVVTGLIADVADPAIDSVTEVV